MEISELTLKLIIILIPGAIVSLIIEKLTVHKEWTPFKFVLNSILFGVFSYLTLQIANDLFTYITNLLKESESPITDLTIWSTLGDSKDIPYREVIASTFFGILIGVLGTLLEHKGIINKIGQRLNISNKYGHQNLYSHFLNKEELGFVYVRNFKNDITYFGYIKSFCETDTMSEIVLGDVNIYTCESGDFLYDIDEIYLSFTKTEIVIEKAKTE